MQGPVRFLPAFAVFLFLVHLGWVLVDPDKPLCDPGTGWHVRLGQLMVQEGRLPDTDPLSYTLPGHPWIDYQWLSHVLMGLLHQAGGLPLVTAGWSVLFGLIPVLMARRLMAEGVPVLVSWFLAFLGYLILTMHAQVRPHVVTYLFLPVLMGVLVRGGRGRWILPVLFLFWANFHAGFVAGLVVLACYAAGEGLAGFWKARRIPWADLTSWLGLGVACGLATAINPWGFGLHRHILDLMGTKSVALWHEYQPVWHMGGANVGLFYLLAVAWMGIVFARFRSLRGGEILAGAVLLFFAAGSARHVNLFVIVALPVVGTGLRDIVERLRPAGVEAAGNFLAGQMRGWATWGYVALLSAGFAALSLQAPGFFRQDFRGMQVGAAALGVIEGFPASGRLFHPESLGGILAYTFGPERKIFIDDRLDYYGDDFFLGTYFPLMSGGDNWRELLSAHGVGVALVPVTSGLARVMSGAPEWEKVWSDGQFCIFRRRP